MSNDISYVIKAIDGFSKPAQTVQGSLNKLNRQVRTSNRLMLEQNKVIRKGAGIANNVAQGNKTLGDSMNKVGKGSVMLGSNLKALLGVGALYKGWQFSKELFRVQSDMQGVKATFEAVTPKFFKVGSASKLAANEIAFLKETTQDLGVSFEGAVRPYSKFMAASNMGIKSTRSTFKSFAGFARLFNLSSAEFGGVVKALEQMQSKGSVMSEELKLQLGDRMPGVLKLFADSAGVSTKKFIKMMEKGQVGANLMARTGEQIQRDYGDKIKAASKSMGAEAARAANDILYMKQVLSTNLTPAMNSFIKTSRTAAQEMGDFFFAMGDKKSFNEMDDGMQNLVTTMKVLGGLAEGFVEAMSGIKPLAKFLVDIMAAPKTGLDWIGNKLMDNEAAKYKQSLSEMKTQRAGRTIQREGIPTPFLQQSMMSKSSNASQSKAAITVDFANAPRGTQITTQTEKNSNLDLGYNLSYGTGGDY
jgi:tape measure domain-containing protein